MAEYGYPRDLSHMKRRNMGEVASGLHEMKQEGEEKITKGGRGVRGGEQGTARQKCPFLKRGSKREDGSTTGRPKGWRVSA